MLNRLNLIGTSRWYWTALIVLGLSMEATALFYQYVLDYYPCVLCIHVRIWVMCLVLIALVALPLRKNRFLRATMHALTVVVMAGLLDRSWWLLGTERGFLEGSCDFDLGLPAWLALDSWLPAVFQVQEACGYTPVLLFGVTMAEALLVMSSLLLLATIALTVATVITRTSN